jgi:hypothetical protein
MKRFLLAVFALLAGAVCASGQSYTTVTATVTDNSSAATAYALGTYNVVLVNNTGQQATFGGSGNFQQSYTGQSLSSTGFLSIVLPSVTAMSPVGLQWQFNICANPQQISSVFPPVALPCFSYTSTGTLISGSSVNLSTQIKAAAATIPLVGGSGGGLPAGGTVGQALINTGSGTGSWQDPNISNTPMVLLNGVGATVTQTTASAVKIPIQSAVGVLAITGAGITGSPVGCTVALELQQSTGAPVSAAIFTQAFTPGNSYQSFTASPSPGFTSGDNMLAVYSCATTYPTGGTVTVTFSPQYTGPSPSNGGISNGIWVVGGVDVLWAQYTSQGMTNQTVHSSIRILKPDGTISTTAMDVNASCTSAVGGVGHGIVAPVSGWLQGFTSEVVLGGQPMGSVYVNHYILVSMPTSGASNTCTGNLLSSNIGTVLSGALTGSFYPVGYPNSGIQSAWSQPGFTSAVAVTNPSAGADFTSVSLGANGHICPTGAFFTLTTSATAGNRIVGIRIILNSVAQLFWIAATPQPPSTTVLYSFAPGATAQQQILGGVNIQSVPFNTGIPICGNISAQITIGSFTGGLQAGDQFSSISIPTVVHNDNN